MPKTIEELEKEMKELKAGHAGQIKKYQEDLDAATAHSVKQTKDNGDLVKELTEYRKAKRDDLEALGHAIDKDEDFKDWSNESINKYVKGYEIAKKNLAQSHSLNGQTQTPQANTGNQTPPVDRATAFLDC